MQLQGSVGAAVVAALLSLPCQVFVPCQAWAFDDTLYPDLTGQWVRADAFAVIRSGKAARAAASRRR